MLQVLIIVAFISRSNHFIYIELNSQNHHELGNSCSPWFILKSRIASTLKIGRT